MALSVSQTAALDAQPRRHRVTQHTHQRWSAESDSPSPVFALAQDRAGFLWVGAGLALYRFDGLHFYPVALPPGAKGSPLALHAARNGDVWVNFAASRRFYVYRAGRLQPIVAPDPGGTVIKFAEERDGTIWAGMGEIGRGLLRYHAGSWTRFGQADGLPNDELLGIEVTRDGAVWVSYVGSVLRLAPDTRRFEKMLTVPDGRARIVQDPAGRIWLYANNQIRAITGPGGAGKPPTLRWPYRLAAGELPSDLSFDSRGTLWIAMHRHGIRRIAEPNPAGEATRAEAVAAVESFDITNGLTSNNVRQAIEDREGNVWIPTEVGLDKFRPASFQFEKRLTHTGTYNDRMLATRAGAVFIGQIDTLYRVLPGGEPEPILQNPSEPQAMCEAPDGAVWIAFRDRILAWKDGAVRRSINAPETETGFEDCSFDSNGTFWITGAGSGMFRLVGDRLKLVFGPSGRDQFAPNFIRRDARGRLVVQWKTDEIAWLNGTRRVTRTFTDGSDRPMVRTFTIGPDDRVIAGGTFGLARLSPQGVSQIASDRFDAASKIRGIVQTPGGETWLASQVAVFRVASKDLSRAFDEPAFSPPTLRLSTDDGLPGRIGVQSNQPMVLGGDGRLWLTTQEGITWIDPTRLVRNTTPPLLAILALTAGGKRYDDPAQLHLPARTTDLKFDFSVLSYANPKNNQIRYRLVGYDETWIDPGNRREAFFTNLPPGEYRFQVRGANNEGVWSARDAEVVFDIEPTFFQTPWFYTLCGIALLLVGFALHRIRLAQASIAIRKRLEDGLRERERIARELHDTLFQSVQGLILHFHAAVGRLSPEDPIRPSLTNTLNYAETAVTEGREILTSLRDADGTTDLRIAIMTIALGRAELDTPATLRIEGRSQPVEPLICAEIARIVNEAVANARFHANASAIAVIATFDREQLRVEITDDGDGWPEAVLETGRKAGHYGLVGMRERADRSGGSFSLLARSKGASVMLTIPARIAYLETATRLGLWASLRTRFRHK